jgi:hypothetical protein
MLDWLILLCTTLLPLLSLTRRSLSQRGVHVDHVTAFSLGFLVYVSVPVAVGWGQIAIDIDGANLFYTAVDAVPLATMQVYLACSALAYLAFLVRFHRSSYAIGPPVVYLGYETTNLYPTLDR